MQENKKKTVLGLRDELPILEDLELFMRYRARSNAAALIFREKHFHDNLLWGKCDVSQSHYFRCTFHMVTPLWISGYT